MKHIALIGAGNLAASLINGLLRGGNRPLLLTVADINAKKCEALKARFPDLRSDDNNAHMVRKCDTVLLCVKPDQLQGVCAEIQDALAESRAMPISVAAGVTLAMLTKWLKADAQSLPLLRCMPNLPVAVGAGMSVLCANSQVDSEQRALAESIFTAVGQVAWLKDETLMDLVTALSGSGPAYFFRIIQALEQAAQTLGMDAELAKRLTQQTALGAAKFVQNSQDTPAALCAKVSSKGGTTEQALAMLEHADIDGIFAQALSAAAARARDISAQTDNSQPE